MPKSKVADWDITASNNTDVGGINIAQGTAVPSDMDNAMREMMAQHAKFRVSGTLVDTVTFVDPADATKKVRIDAGNVTAGQTRVLTAPNYDHDIGALSMAKAPPEMTWLSISSIRIAAGSCRSEDNTINIVLPLPIDLPVAVAANSHRHVWVGMDGNNNPAALLTTSSVVTAKYRRIGSIRTDASGNVRQFIQSGDHFVLYLPTADIIGSTVSTATVIYALPVPIDVKVKIHARIMAFGATGYVFFIDPDEGIQAPTSSGPLASIYTDGTVNASELDIMTNSSGQVAMKASAASTNIRLVVTGYADRRGRDK